MDFKFIVVSATMISMIPALADTSYQSKSTATTGQSSVQSTTVSRDSGTKTIRQSRLERVPTNTERNTFDMTKSGVGTQAVTDSTSLIRD